MVEKLDSKRALEATSADSLAINCIGFGASELCNRKCLLTVRRRCLSLSYGANVLTSWKETFPLSAKADRLTRDVVIVFYWCEIAQCRHWHGPLYALQRHTARCTYK